MSQWVAPPPGTVFRHVDDCVMFRVVSLEEARLLCVLGLIKLNAGLVSEAQDDKRMVLCIGLENHPPFTLYYMAQSPYTIVKEPTCESGSPSR